MTAAGQVIDWLLGSDPSIRWQVMRDLLGVPERQWRAERAKVETEGWGARLLSCQDEDGQWAGGAFFPRDFDAREWQQVGQPWTATAFSLSQLREFGLDPASAPAQRAVALIGASSRWDEAGQPYWEGEVEECINGRIVADGAYFGADVSSIAGRLTGERLADGGWNCERANGSARSSFATTINVLEGLLEYERATGGTPDSRAARGSGEEFLLARGLFRRLSTGEPADSLAEPWVGRGAGQGGGRPLASRLEAARPRLVPRGRRGRPALLVGDPAGDAGAQLVGAVAPRKRELQAWPGSRRELWLPRSWRSALGEFDGDVGGLDSGDHQHAWLQVEFVGGLAAEQ